MASLIRTGRTAGPLALRPGVRFCSRCGALGQGRAAQAERLTPERVCERCGMGVLLHCPGEALRREGGAFLIVARDLRVAAVSEAAESFFGPEEALLGTPVVSLLRDPAGSDALALGVSRAAGGSREVAVLPVRRADREGTSAPQLEARIATCEPPRAAVIAVEPLAPAGSSR